MSSPPIPLPPPRGRTVTVAYARPLADGVRQTVAASPSAAELARYLVDRLDRPAAAFQLQDCGLDLRDDLGRTRAELRFGASRLDAGPVAAEVWGVEAAALQRAFYALTARTGGRLAA